MEKRAAMRICLPGEITGIGGPASFQRKLVGGLIRRGVEVTFDLDGFSSDAVLVINATRQLGKLWRAKRRGIRIVQRLGGINWLHRRLDLGMRSYLLCETRNHMMRLIRDFGADHIIYQSKFVKGWWEKRYGVARAEASVIYNGVDLEQFSPVGPRYVSGADVCIISVEGTQGADPFNIALQLARGVEDQGFKVELLVFGVPLNKTTFRFSQSFVNFRGAIPNEELPYYYRGATIYISTDIIAACPNSVIEALACGTPVLGYQAGVLPEMLESSAWPLVPCDGDPWQGQPPGNMKGMVASAIELIEGGGQFRRGARRLAEERYGLGHMVDAYYRILLG